MKKTLSLLFAMLSLLLSLSSHAATYTWTGAGFFGTKDYLWSNPNNWAELAAPQNGEQGVQLVFPNTAAPRANTNDVLNLVLSSVVFQGANYNLHGPGANGITMTLRGDNGGPFAVVAAAAGCQFGSSTRLHLGSTGSVAVASGMMFTIKSRVSGIYGFSKISPGTLSFQGLQANTFTGPLTVLQGVADFRGVGTAMSGSLIVGDGNPFHTSSARLYLDDQIGDNSPVTVNANGTLELAAHDDTIGALTLASGTVTTTEGLLTGVLTLNGNVTNRVGVADDAGVIQGKLSLGSTTRGFHVDADTELRIDADISGVTAGLTKSGPGLLTLTGAGNNYAGSTTVQSGQLALRGAAKPGSINNGTIVGQGATLLLWNASVGDELLALIGATNQPVVAFAGTNSWSGAVTLTGDCLMDPFPAGYADDHLTFSGAIGGTGSLRLVGWAHVHFTGLAGNTFTGGYYGEVGFSHFEKSASAPALGGPLFVGRAEDSFPNAHVIVGALNQIPNNSLVTVRKSGALTADAGDTLGHVVIEGGAMLSMGGSFTLSGNVTNRVSDNSDSGIYGDTFLTAGQHVFDVEWLSLLNVYGVLGGAGGIDLRNGLLVLYNANTYLGATHVIDGTLRLTGQGRPGSSAAGTVIDGLGAMQLRGVSVTNETLQLDPWSVYNPRVSVFSTNHWRGPVILNTDMKIDTFGESHLRLDGAISGPAGILYTGDPHNATDGALELTGNTDNTFQGTTTILEGTLLLNKVGRAIAGSLIIGHETNGAPVASVVCQRIGQFKPATDAVEMNTRRLVVNPSGSLDCAGFDQTVAGITTRGGNIYADGAVLTLQQGWKAEPAGSFSYFSGRMRLSSLFSDFTHIFNTETNAQLLFLGDITQGPAVANIRKQGLGEWVLLGSNSFAGLLEINDGRVIAGGDQPFGTVNSPTIVGYGATVAMLTGTNAEPFTLSGRGYANQGALVVSGSNYFHGAISLAYNADIVTPGASNVAVFAGPISGPGGLNKIGDGKIVLAGTGDNTYAGPTIVHSGAIELAKTNSDAIRGALEIRANALVRHLRDGQISDLAPVTIADGGQLRVLGHSDTIGSLAGLGIVELLGGSLITGNDNTATTYAGVISGIGGNLTKTGTNTFTLAGDNAYTGTTFVKGGTLLVRGHQPHSDVVIQTGGTLGGTGAVGSISDLSGHVKPGVNTYGVLKCGGFLTHAPGNVFQIEINGTTPGVNCDQLDVNGTVVLLGGTLQLAMNFSGAVSNEYVIIRNDGGDAVTGSFVGLPPNALLTNNGVAFQISYTGGDGNDVTLIQRSVITGPELGGITKLGDGTIQIGGTGIPNASYSVEATSDLNPSIIWEKIGTATANAQGQFTFTDPDAPQHPVRFYRFAIE